MTFTANREKFYGYAFFALYGLSMIFVNGRHLVLALLSLAASAVCVFQTVPADADDRARQRKQVYLVLAGFLLPGLYIVWDVHQQEVEERRFKIYLSEHRCTYKGDVMVGMSRGGCDRVGNCEEPQEIEDAEFLCASTGNRITYTDFKAGRYGN